jgi:hypothetical protein
MPKPNPFLDHVKAKLHGQPTDMTTATSSPPYAPPGEPVSRDKAMTAGISAKLHGSQAPADTFALGDQTDQQANDGNAQTPEEEARDKLSQLDDGSDIIAALDNPDDELHATAKRLLAAYVALVELRRKKAQP